MSTDATAAPAGAGPDGESFVAKLEAFGEELATLEITGVGDAKFSFKVPTETYSVVEQLGRAIKFTFSVDSGVFKVDAVAAS